MAIPRKQPPVVPLLVLEDNLLVNLANNAIFIKEFPFLRKLAGMAVKSCGGCGRPRTRGDTLRQVKQRIAGLSKPMRDKLKDKLRAKQIRITFRNSQGQTVQRTF